MPADKQLAAAVCAGRQESGGEAYVAGSESPEDKEDADAEGVDVEEQFAVGEQPVRVLDEGADEHGLALQERILRKRQGSGEIPQTTEGSVDSAVLERDQHQQRTGEGQVRTVGGDATELFQKDIGK